MFFSVIVPVYKVEEYLPACIESVLNQTFSDFELILVDDGSPDTCPQICEDYAARDSRIRVVHKPNGGLASARQAGIRVATGEYVYNLDSDDSIQPDTLECAHRIIQETSCEIVSFARDWVKDGQSVNRTDDGLPEGLYTGRQLEEHIYPRILMNQNMENMAYYLAGKAILRSFLTPLQLGVNERISLGEDLCCVVPCYLNAHSVYISHKSTYLYTIRENSISKEFNTKQIHQIEDVMEELVKNNWSKVADFEAQLDRYFCFMCFAILALAAEGNYFKSIPAIREAITHSTHYDKIRRATFAHLSPKSRVAIFLMQHDHYGAAFYFLNICKKIRCLLKGR